MSGAGGELPGARGAAGGRGGLTACSRCCAIVAVSDAESVASRPVCRECLRKAGSAAAPAAASPGAIAAFRPAPPPARGAGVPGAALPDLPTGPASPGSAPPPGGRAAVPVREGSGVVQVPRFQASGAAPPGGSDPPRPKLTPAVSRFGGVMAAPPGPPPSATGAGAMPPPPAGSVPTRAGPASASPRAPGPHAPRPFVPGAPVPTSPAPLPAARPTGGGATAVSEDGFTEYARLRQELEAGETLELRRRAAELAARLSFPYEALEHYERCVALDPQDDRLRMRLENVRRSVGLVADGKGEIPAPQPAGRILEEAPPFWTDLGGALAWPLRGNGKAVLLVGGVFFALIQLLGAFNVYGWVIALGLWGYVCSHLFAVINASGAGKTAPPELPEVADLLESYVFPFFSFACCAFLSYVPCMLAAWAWGKGWLPGPVGPVATVLLFALGAFVFPMTLMIRGMFQAWSEAGNPGFVLGSIGRILPDYVAAYVAITVVWAAYAVASVVAWFLCAVTLGAPTPDAVLQVDGLRILSWLAYTVVTWPLFLYAWTLEGHLLGRTYRQSMIRLAWFVRATEATRRARRMWATLWIAAGGAAVLLCGVAWAATKIVDLRTGRVAFATAGAACPVRDGSRLTYFWEHTDGQAGITVFHFSAAPGGDLSVKAVSRTTGEFDYPMSEDLGTFSPTTGIWTKPARVGGSILEGFPGEHVPFYGPAKPRVGGTYVDDWPVRGQVRWQEVWTSWKVTHTRTTAELYFDSRTGLLVGRRQVGIGWTSTAWLVCAEGTPPVQPGPPAPYGFAPVPATPTGGRTDPLDGGEDGFDGFPR